MNIINKLTNYLIEGDDQDKLARWGETFGKNHGTYPDEKGFFDTCVTHMKGNVDDPEAYCARVKDSYNGSTFWRGKDKKPKEAKSDIKKHQNYPKGEHE
jgi:hypothetical protein